MPTPGLDAGSLPLQPSPLAPPLAMQPVALLLVQSMSIDCPTCTLVGVTLNVLMLAAEGVALTVTMIELGALAPPPPLQVSV